jgi:hypothetical protein
LTGQGYGFDFRIFLPAPDSDFPSPRVNAHGNVTRKTFTGARYQFRLFYRHRPEDDPFYPKRYGLSDMLQRPNASPRLHRTIYGFDNLGEEFSMNGMTGFCSREIYYMEARNFQ